MVSSWRFASTGRARAHSLDGVVVEYMSASLPSVGRVVPVNTEQSEVETGVERIAWSRKKRLVIRFFQGGFRHQPTLTITRHTASAGKVIVKIGGQMSVAAPHQSLPCELEYVDSCVDRGWRKQSNAPASV